MGRRGMQIGYWWESQKERDHYEDQEVGGMIILKQILETNNSGGVGWIGPASDRDAVTNLPVGKLLSVCTNWGPLEKGSAPWGYFRRPSNIKQTCPCT
jgi:hypothetical protein